MLNSSWIDVDGDEIKRGRVTRENIESSQDEKWTTGYCEFFVSVVSYAPRNFLELLKINLFLINFFHLKKITI